MIVNRIARVALVALELFLAATAIYGAIYVVPVQPRALLAGSPFSDYTIPAFGLGVLVGGGALLAAVSLILRPRIGALLSVVSGVSIIVFELVETVVVGLDVWLHALGLGPASTLENYGSLEGIPMPLGVPLPLWLQPFYLIVGLLIVGLALGQWITAERGGAVVRPSAVRQQQHPALRAMIEPVGAVLIFIALCGVFGAALHPWLMNWGSTPEEQAMALPGDTAPPSTYFTRAITINAPPSAVWPWLLAIGQDRAGFLSNDYLENLTGADIHNADALRPEWQQRAIGDRVPMGSPGQRALIGDATTTIIHTLEAERAIGDTPGRFVLLPQGESSTRLLLRESLEDPLRSGAMWVLWDPMHFVMEQRMLQGIKERAEGQPFVPPVVQAAAHVGWALAGVGLFGVFITRRGWRAWLVLPVGVMVAPLWLSGDINSFIAGFLAIGITLAGFLAFGWRWFAPYLLLASGVALVLLVAPDSYAAFGLIFLLLVAGTVGASRHRVYQLLPIGRSRWAPVSSAAL